MVWLYTIKALSVCCDFSENAVIVKYFQKFCGQHWKFFNTLSKIKEWSNNGSTIESKITEY